MKALVLSTKNELVKLAAKKKYFVIILLGAAVCILRMGGNLLVSRLSGGEIVVKSNLIMEMLGFVTDILVPLIVFMGVTDLFSSEAAEDTLKASLMRPLTRFKVMTSKTLAALILSWASMIAIFIVCLAVSIFSGNGGSGALTALCAYLIDMIPIIALAAMAVLINMLVKSPTLAMLLCIVVYIFFKYLNFYVSPVGQMILTAYSRWHKIWIGTSLPLSALVSKIGILFGSVLILYALSYIIFDGKDY